MRRASVLSAASALAAALLSAAAASAATPVITTPAATTHPLIQPASEGGGAGTITVAGTATPSTKVDVRCYWGSEPSDFSALGEAEASAAGEFAVQVARSAFPHRLCRLRAAAHGEALSLALKDESENAGPLVAPTLYEPPSVLPGTYELSTYVAGSTSADVAASSAEKCGLSSAVYNPATLEELVSLFACAARVQDSPKSPSTGLRIDGDYGYGPAAAGELATEGIGSSATVPALHVREENNPASGAAEATEEVPIVRCWPESLPTPTAKSCSSFVPTGVTLIRSWHIGEDDEVAELRDSWHSGDDRPHKLAVRYGQQLAQDSSTGGSFAPPEASAYEPDAAGTLALTPEAGGVLYKSDALDGENSEDPEHPQGAIVYDRGPGEPAPVTVASGEGHTRNSFEMPYSGTIPAAGSYILRMAYIQETRQAKVLSLAEEQFSSFYPSLFVGAPRDHEIIQGDKPYVTVAGEAFDSGQLSSVTVDGLPVEVEEEGTWEVSVGLHEGANAIYVTATDQAGLTTSSQLTVDYVPSSTPGAGSNKSTAPVVPASAAGTVISTTGQVAIVLSCAGSAGTHCTVQSSLTSRVRSRGRRLLAVSAGGRAVTRTVAVGGGSGTTTIAAGSKTEILLGLNGEGRALLARFHQLPVHLTASMTGSASAFMAQNLIVRQPPKKKRRRR